MEKSRQKYLPQEKIKEREEKEAIQKLKAQQIKEDLIKTLSIPEARRTLVWLIANTGYKKNNFHQNSQVMSNLCGQSSVGSNLMLDIFRVAPKEHGLIETEITKKITGEV